MENFLGWVLSGSRIAGFFALFVVIGVFFPLGWLYGKCLEYLCKKLFD